MLKNYFTTAVRNLFKHKVFSFINIFGLAIGIAACLLILQYVSFELSYDKFEKNSGRIYRMQLNRYNDGKLSTQWAAGAAGIGLAMKQTLPEVESYAELHGADGVVSYKEQQFAEENMYFSNDNFLPMFSYKAVEGNINGALKDVNTAVITAATAKKYFGNEDPLGKMIALDKNNFFKITAVVQDPPPNTHFKFSVLFSFASFIKFTDPGAETRWDWDGFYTYVLLKPGIDTNLLAKKIAKMVIDKWGPEMKKSNHAMVFNLQPLQDIHLTSHYMLEAEVNGDSKSVYFLLVISFFIVAIAWINYINLSTARSMDRAKEVGVRKVMGSHRAQLINQFMFESFLINLLAVLLAFILIIIFLPLFNALTEKEVTLSLVKNIQFWIALIALFVGGTFLAGLYPAFVLSSFKPIAVLKGKLSKTKGGAFLRQSLVVIQFAASVALMVGTFGVYRQLHFMQKQDLGMQIEQTLVLRGPSVLDSTYSDKLSAFKTEMLNVPGIKKIAASTEVPGRKVQWNAGGIGLVGGDPSKTNQYRIIGIDYDFVDAFGLKILKGRNFLKQFSTDPDAVLFNEAAVKQLGFNKPEDALNKRIEFWGHQYTIIGVVSNHHQESLKQDYDAHIFRLIPNSNSFYSLKLQASGKNLNEIIRVAKTEWTNFFPGNPFDYFFLDEHFAQQYKADQLFGKTFGLFAVLAIVVACMGLLGLASFVTTQRTKEIGIRKVSGAGTLNILVLLTKDFIKPVIVAFAIATPITYYLLNKWLEGYAFRASVNFWMFIVPAILILSVAILTITTQTLKAASANPVDSLRTE
jgi:putative ABC transport system permease protein